MIKPFVSVIIANYNGEKFLEVCISSVVKNKYKNYELIVIDDGSTDGSTEIIETFLRKSKKICFLSNAKNLGAASSRNKAAKVARGKVLVFLDNDTEVERDWLIELLKPLRLASVGATQSMIRDFRERKIIQNPGMKLWATTGWGLPLAQWVEDKGQFKEDESIIAISASLAVKKKVFDLIGGFDKDESVFTEDIDLSWRIWICGYKVVLASKSVVYHWTKDLIMREDMKHSQKIIYFHLSKNSFRSMLKNYEFKNILRYLLGSVILNFIRGLLVLIKRGDPSALLATIHAILWNLTHLADTLQSRMSTQKIRRFRDKYLFDLIFEKGNLLEIYNKYFRATKLLS